jgi:uncharacterized alkaline shock family protein YloU/adenylate kinase family enzyme
MYRVSNLKDRILTKLGQFFRPEPVVPSAPPEPEPERLPKVYALIGRSGTGKSFRARLIADEHGIEAMIDDGLLIHKGKILAGRSAKETQHYIAAVKTALFTDPEHLAQVLAALKEAQFKKILLLGTSERMILRNCATLGLAEPSEIIRIEDVATAEEIATAIHDRKAHGRHIIPLPVIEVKQAYPKLVARAIKVLFDRALHSKATYEKTIVRPSFHSKGKVTISEVALTQMILHCMRQKAAAIKILKIRITPGKEGYDIKVRIAMPFGAEAANTCEELRTYVIREIESYTGIRIRSLVIHIESVAAGESAERTE